VVGVVSQEPILFATTIAENIRYGRPGATDDEVRGPRSGRQRRDGFVLAFPEGYSTLVGERGVRLSGGQKQRVAIARALLKDPRCWCSTRPPRRSTRRTSTSCRRPWSG
jgi:ABC-type multidrug transport system fused ATPase/permease subunit